VLKVARGFKVGDSLERQHLIHDHESIRKKKQAWYSSRFQNKTTETKMQITGIIEKILPIQTGEGRNGTWVKQDVVINQGGKYPKSACVTFFGTKCTPEGYSEGESVVVDVNIESKPWNDKYITSVNAWKIARSDGAHPATQAARPEQRKEPDPIQSQDTDDLPF